MDALLYFWLSTYVICQVIKTRGAVVAWRLTEGLDRTAGGSSFWPGFQLGFMGWLKGWLFFLEPVNTILSAIWFTLSPKTLLARALTLQVQPHHWGEAQRRLDAAFPETG